MADRVALGSLCDAGFPCQGRRRGLLKRLRGPGVPRSKGLVLLAARPVFRLAPPRSKS